jgi:hypothetical protein
MVDRLTQMRAFPPPVPPEIEERIGIVRNRGSGSIRTYLRNGPGIDRMVTARADSSREALFLLGGN